MDVSYLIMLHIDRNFDKKFQPSIFYRSWENQLWKIKASTLLELIPFSYGLFLDRQWSNFNFWVLIRKITHENHFPHKKIGANSPVIKWFDSLLKYIINSFLKMLVWTLKLCKLVHFKKILILILKYHQDYDSSMIMILQVTNLKEQCRKFSSCIKYLMPKINPLPLHD